MKRQASLYLQMQLRHRLGKSENAGAETTWARRRLVLSDESGTATKWTRPRCLRSKDLRVATTRAMRILLMREYDAGVIGSIDEVSTTTWAQRQRESGNK